MNTITFHPTSLNPRVAMLTLVIFVASILSLAFYNETLPYQDLQRILGEQQFETVTMVADEVNDELNNRVLALESVAAVITPAMLANPAAMQTMLESRPVFLRLFNGGVFSTDKNGTATTSVPRTVPRIGTNYLDRDHIAAALKNNKTTFSKPFIGQRLQAPVFAIATPLHNAQGQVVGSLVGVTNLSLPNFLNHSFSRPDSQTGRFFLAAPQHGVFVCANDKSLVLKALPAPGVNRMRDRYSQGFEGYGITVNSSGVEELTAGHQVPVAGWYVAVARPTAQVFAPIRAMQLRLLVAASLLILLAAALTWWLLRRKLAPLLSAASKLALMPVTGDFPSALPITRRDEVGQLIAGFNRLLETLHQRETALTRSELRFRTLIEWSPEALAVHRDGKIIYANPAAAKLMGANSAQDMVGKPMLELVHPESWQVVMERVKKATVLGDILPMAEEKFIRFDDAVIDVEVIGIIIDFDGQSACQVAVRDVTERNRTHRELQASLRDKVALLNEVHHRVKNNLQVITSLLRLEAARSSQGETRTVLTDMQGRIRSMALLHESLYRSGVFASIDLGRYIKQLASQSFRALVTPANAVRLEFELASVQVSLDQATPCGLLINELISNSLKHGFPDGRSGELRIELQALLAEASVATLDAAPAEAGSPGNASRVRLRVSDTGIGLPADFMARRSQSLGLQLVEDLTRQLNATLEIGAGPGAQFCVTFALQPSKAAPTVL